MESLLVRQCSFPFLVPYRFGQVVLSPFLAQVHPARNHLHATTSTEFAFSCAGALSWYLLGPGRWCIHLFWPRFILHACSSIELAFSIVLDCRKSIAGKVTAEQLPQLVHFLQALTADRD